MVLSLTAPSLGFALAAQAATVVGGEAGMGFATLNGDAPSFVNPIASPAAGLFARIGLSPTLSLQTEALVTTKGGAVEIGQSLSAGGMNILPKTGLFDSTNPNASGVRVTSLEVPVLLRIKPDRSDAMSPTLSIGPALGFELLRQTDPRGVAAPVSTVQFTKAPDLGLVLGVGVEKPHANSRWSFDARTTLGLTNLATGPYQTHGIRNVSLVTMIGYGWSHGAP